MKQEKEMIKAIINQKLRSRKYVFTALLLICILLVGTVFAFADDNDNTVQNEQSGSSTTQTVDTTVLRISASDTSGLHAVVLSVIGDYNSIVKDYTYQTTSYNGSVQTNHVVEITPDFSWIATALLFIVMIYCLFRFLGALISGGKL